MKSTNHNKGGAAKILWLALAALFIPVELVLGAAEEKFGVLQTKTGSYTNVTVSSKTKEWVFILHSAGMGNIRISDLPDDAKEKLGYALPKKKISLKPIAMPTMQELKNIKLPEVSKLEQSWREGGAKAVMDSFGSRNVVWTALGVLGVIYLFFCYCCMMICRRANTEPGILVWLPVLQIIPLLRAAGMPLIWFFAFLVPVVNLLAQLIWYVRIVDARGKGRLLVLWLVLPITTPFAFLYLAFSESAPAPMQTAKHSSLVLGGA